MMMIILLFLCLTSCVVCQVDSKSQKGHYFVYADNKFDKKIAPASSKPFTVHTGTNWTGQSKQDAHIFDLLQKKQNGYYVDLAANHYIHLSNTFRLEQTHGWTGLCIEPNSMYLEELVHRRSCEVLVNPVSDNNGDKVKFHMNAYFGGIVAPGMDNAEGNKLPNKQDAEGDVILETVKLPTALQHFQAPKVIDFMSLDVEGGELLVLRGMEGFWDQYTFLSILIERPSKKLHMMLVKQDYRAVNILNAWGDVLYIHPTTPGFADRMAVREDSLKKTKYGKTHGYLLKDATSAHAKH